MIRDYDLPDTEVRKVLIEELTKEQLMREQEEERRRILAEHEREKRERKRRLELEKQRLAKEKERLRIQKQKEKERQRIQKEREKERELARLKKEKERIEANDAKRGELFALEITRQLSGIEATVAKREADLLKKQQQEEKRQQAAQKLKKVQKKSKEKPVEEVAKLLKDEIHADIDTIVDDAFENVVAELTANEALTDEQREMSVKMDEMIYVDENDDFVEEMQVTLSNLIKKHLEAEIDEHISVNADVVVDEALRDFDEDKQLMGTAELSASIDEAVDESSDQFVDSLQTVIEEKMKEEIVKSLDSKEEKKPERLREILRKWLVRK